MFCRRCFGKMRVDYTVPLAKTGSLPRFRYRVYECVLPGCSHDKYSTLEVPFYIGNRIRRFQVMYAWGKTLYQGAGKYLARKAKGLV